VGRAFFASEEDWDRIRIALKVKKVAHGILAWHREQGRHHLPWRTERTPYRVLTSEFFLGRTRAEQVAPVFLAIQERWADLSSLAAADADELREVIRPLGLIGRADRLIATANMLLEHHGGIPETWQELIQFPGMGPYISAATACFAFGQEVTIIDANVLRVYQRIYASDLEDGTVTLGYLIEAHPLYAPSYDEWNYAIIDFGGLVCKARGAKHDLCPLTDVCDHFQINQ
jgi:A/G-specific adenine glycosylase